MNNGKYSKCDYVLVIKERILIDKWHNARKGMRNVPEGINQDPTLLPKQERGGVAGKKLRPALQSAGFRAEHLGK